MRLLRGILGPRDETVDQSGLPTITPGELRRLIHSGENVVVLDVRQPTALSEYPGAIPGSVRIPPSEVPRRYRELPRGSVIVPY
jgi:rhodanese-related sulfurtransferase